MCSALRFCFEEYFDLLPRGIKLFLPFLPGFGTTPMPEAICFRYGDGWWPVKPASVAKTGAAVAVSRDKLTEYGHYVVAMM